MKTSERFVISLNISISGLIFLILESSRLFVGFILQPEGIKSIKPSNFPNISSFSFINSFFNGGSFQYLTMDRKPYKEFSFYGYRESDYECSQLISDNKSEYLCIFLLR